MTLNCMTDRQMFYSIRWYGHAFRREDGHGLEKGIRFWGWGLKVEREAEEDVEKHVQEGSVMVALRREDALCRSKWSVDIIQIATRLR